MTTKQVKTVAAAQAVTNSTNTPQNLFISVNTFDGATGKTVGEQILDLFHYGTEKRLRKHYWWAMHNGHTVEQQPATLEQITAYLEMGKQALVDKYNNTPKVVEEAPAKAA